MRYNIHSKFVALSVCKCVCLSVYLSLLNNWPKKSESLFSDKNAVFLEDSQGFVNFLQAAHIAFVLAFSPISVQSHTHILNAVLQILLAPIQPIQSLFLFVGVDSTRAWWPLFVHLNFAESLFSFAGFIFSSFAQIGGNFAVIFRRRVLLLRFLGVLFVQAKLGGRFRRVQTPHVLPNEMLGVTCFGLGVFGLLIPLESFLSSFKPLGRNFGGDFGELLNLERNLCFFFLLLGLNLAHFFLINLYNWL